MPLARNPGGERAAGRIAGKIIDDPERCPYADAHSAVAAAAPKWAAMLAEGTKQMVRFWTDGSTALTPRKKKKSRQGEILRADGA
jgi:hypothetical protein